MTTSRDTDARIEKLQAELRRVADYRAKGLMRPEEADAQETLLRKQLLEAVLPDVPAPGARPRERLAAVAAMLAVVGAVFSWLMWGHAGLTFKTDAMLAMLARERAASAAAPAQVAPLPDAGSAVPASAATAAPVPADAWVSGRVEVAPALAGRVRPDDSVFITLRHPGEPGLPLATVRKRADDLPLHFALGPADVLGDVSRVTGSAAPVVVEARISRTGQGLALPGDLEGGTPPVPVGARGVRVVISTVHGGG